jgi:hypothetical protein
MFEVCPKCGYSDVKLPTPLSGSMSEYFDDSVKDDKGISKSAGIFPHGADFIIVKGKKLRRGDASPNSKAEPFDTKNITSGSVKVLTQDLTPNQVRLQQAQSKLNKLFASLPYDENAISIAKSELEAAMKANGINLSDQVNTLENKKMGGIGAGASEAAKTTSGINLG